MSVLSELPLEKFQEREIKFLNYFSRQPLRTTVRTFLIVIVFQSLVFTGLYGPKIAIVTILKDRSDRDNYELAQNLFKCCAIHHN